MFGFKNFDTNKDEDIRKIESELTTGPPADFYIKINIYKKDGGYFSFNMPVEMAKILKEKIEDSLESYESLGSSSDK